MKNLLPLLPLLILVSCKKYESEDVDQNKIRQTYQVVYNTQTNTTEVTASFRYKKGLGNPVQLSGAAQITYGNRPMQYYSMDNSYRLFINGYTMTDTFKYTNNTGQLYKNSAPYVSPLQFNFGGSIYMDKRNNFTLSINNITGTTYYNSIKLNIANRTYFATRTNFNYMFTITPEQMNDINNGFYFGTISNELTNDVQQQTNGGGKITAIYHSNVFGIQVYN